MVGIYKITNPSGMIYIGQSYNINKRIRSHFSNSNRAARIRLYHYPIYNSINKYGMDAHTVNVIHELPVDVAQTVMDNYEQLYILLYKETGVSLLNLTDGGNSGKRSQETKNRMSKSAMGKIISKEQRNKISIRLTGTKQPKDVVEKRAATLRALKRKVTDKHKSILSASLMGNERNKIPVTLLNINTGENHYFSNLKKAAIFLQVNYITFKRYYNGKRDGYPNLDKKYGTNTISGFKIIKTE